jgi:hypothetical protein
LYFQGAAGLALFFFTLYHIKTGADFASVKLKLKINAKSFAPKNKSGGEMSRG